MSTPKTYPTAAALFAECVQKSAWRESWLAARKAGLSVQAAAVYATSRWQIYIWWLPNVWRKFVLQCIACV